jgi:signal transduction histidine kinase
MRLAVRPHLPRRTIRLRLTLVYGGLFLASGAALLAITYVLVVHATDGFIFKGQHGVGFTTSSKAPAGGVKKAGERPHLTTVGPASKGLTPRQIEAQARQLQQQAKQQHASVLHQLLVQSGIALAAMALLSILLGWIVAGRVLRPLRTITGKARDISATNLHERLALEGPDDELKELGDTFDALLARLEASFQAQRQFVANASHELRTPLARQRTLGQVALADPDATIASLRAAHERVLVAGAEQERLIDALLALARGQTGVANQEPIDLADVAERVLAAHQPEAERHELEVYARLSPAPVTGDSRLIERLVTNLVDNAQRYNLPHGRLEVATGTQNGHAVLSVSNSGPVVPPEAVDELFQPFKRLGADRTNNGAGGVGLGLSIVQAIAEAHGATVVARPQAAGGLEVSVRLASAASPQPASR